MRTNLIYIVHISDSTLFVKFIRRLWIQLIMRYIIMIISLLLYV